MSVATASPTIKIHSVPKQRIKPSIGSLKLPCQSCTANSKGFSEAKYCCEDCARILLCKACDQSFHAVGAKGTRHRRTKISVNELRCQTCKRAEVAAAVYCKDCDKCLCRFCADVSSHHHHQRVALSPATSDGNRQQKLPDMLEMLSLESDSSLSDRSCTKLDVPFMETVGGRFSDGSPSAGKVPVKIGVLENGSSGGVKTNGRSFLLLDKMETLQVRSLSDFIGHLVGCEEYTLVKVVSIFGNTGEGKSYTLNHSFFNGEEVFSTSPSQDSCTFGVWAAYDDQLKAIVIDTEGLLGVSANENQRTRLLLKVMAISDVIIYRTRAERLHNDLFKFLGDASHAYLGHFQKELRAASEKCGTVGDLSQLGPSLVVFQETQHTDVLKNSTTSGDCSEKLKRRFQELGYSYEAYSSIEYVGTRTVSLPTCFKGLYKIVDKNLKNYSVRSARAPVVVYQALQVLNTKFSGQIEKTVSETFPDQYFTCSSRCMSCGIRCQRGMGHQVDNIPHTSSTKCKYQHQFDNRIFICKVCHENGNTTVVIPKTSSSSDSTWLGLAKYAWSGYVLECNNCGIIFRSRQYWFGNQEVDTVVRTEIQHVWPGVNCNWQNNQNAAQKVLDGVSYLSNAVTTYSAAPTKMLTSWMADKIAPPYWKPNSEIIRCGICKVLFGPTDTKHHCRACGDGFCEDCSNYFKPVPERGWGATDVRVCKKCNDKIDLDQDAVEQNEVMARRVGEILHNTIGTVVSVIDYPIGVIKDSARPTYWVPDENLIECHVCQSPFSVKVPKHHCRGCGEGVCATCSPDLKPVPSRGWDHPVRVCKNCATKDL